MKTVGDVINLHRFVTRGRGISCRGTPFVYRHCEEYEEFDVEVLIAATKQSVFEIEEFVIPRYEGSHRFAEAFASASREQKSTTFRRDIHLCLTTKKRKKLNQYRMEKRFKIITLFLMLCSISWGQSLIKVKNVYMRNGLSYVKSSGLTVEGITQTLSQNMQVNGSITINSTLKTGSKELYINSNSASALTIGASGKLIIEAGGTLKRKISGSSGFSFPLTVSETNSLSQTTNTLNTFTFYKTSGSDANFSIQRNTNGTGFDILNNDASNTTTIEFEYTLDGGNEQRFKFVVSSGTITSFQVKDTITNTFIDVPGYLYTLTGSPANRVGIINPRGFLSSFIGFAGETNLNWVHMVYYGEANQVVSEQHQYFDGFGRATQAQLKNIDEDLVLAQQNVYDANGAAGLQTLYAPIGNAFAYKTNFITPSSSSSTPYSYTNFDASTKYFNPDAVYASTANTLGHYYSNSGPENYISTTTYPFSRTYSNGNMVFSSAAGSDHKMGSNHESKAIAMPAGNELNTYLYDADSLFKVHENSTDPFALSQYSGTIKAVKTINIDNDGKETVSYSANGLTLATCVSGLTSEAGNLTNVTYQFSHFVREDNSHPDIYNSDDLSYIDIHLPKNKNSSLKLSALTYLTPPSTTTPATYTTHYTYTIFDLQAGALLVSGTDYSINTTTWDVTFYGAYATKSLYLRVFLNLTPTGEILFFLNSPTLTLTLDYGHWTLNYYDLSGQLLRSVTPKGVNTGSPGVFKQFCSSYAYSNLGQLVRSKTPDAGVANMVYNNEGQLRFSQNAEQLANNKFSYINYDAHGRIVETGEYYSDNNNYNFQNYYNNSVIFESCMTCDNTNDVLNSLDGLADGDCYNEYKTWYGKLQSGDEIPTGYSYKSQYTQKYVQGQVSRISNENSIMWFSYDQMGRTTFTVEQITEALYTSIKTSINDQIKTTNYTYNLQSGQLSQYVYNTNGTDKLTHAYTYSKAGALTNTDITIYGGSAQNVAKYYYYTHGALKRAELGGVLQGVDYVYTIHGQLKSINNPWQDAAKDPGTDGQGGTSHASFANDLFSYGLDYYSGDYSRSGTNITSTASGGSNFYSGLVSAQRYRYNYAAACSVQTGGTNYQLITPANKYEQFIKQFTYDELNRMATATLGKYDQQTPATTTFTEYKEFGGSGAIAYDANSNITNLKRNAYNKSSNYDYHNLTYTYDTINNKLKEVTDVSGVNGYVGTSAFDTSGTRAFTYTALGQLKSSSAEHIDTAYYYPDGKTKRVKYSSGNYVNYYYNCTNQLMRTSSKQGSDTAHTWYVYSANGALQSVYKKSTGVSFALSEQPVYAGGRIGVVDRAHSNEIIYHLSDHLGNTRMAFKNNGSNQPTVTMYADYYAFGGLMPGRFNNNVTGGANNTNTYQYQGQQKDPQANWSQFELRMFNSDLGRWFAPDPYNQFASPYNGMGNNPISLMDPNGGYAINGGNAGINSYGRHYDAIGLNAYSSQARYDDWAQAIRNYYNGTATLQEMNYFASMAGQDYAQITCQESILNNYHHNNSVINEMNDAIDLSLESGTTKDLFDLANGVTGYAGIISGANYVDQNFGRISTLASLGGFDLGDGKTLVYGNNGDLVVRDNSVKVENEGETVGIMKLVWDRELGTWGPHSAVVIGNADKTLISAADINKWFKGLNGEHWTQGHAEAAFSNGFRVTGASNMYSPSAILGYIGAQHTKTEKLLKYTTNGAKTWSDKANGLKAMKGAAFVGKSMGVLGAGLTFYENATDADGFTAGDAFKVGVGLLTTFTPWGWAYGLVDIGVGMATGTTLTDRIGAGIDGALNR
jgi:RHS repeat-associated protein